MHILRGRWCRCVTQLAVTLFSLICRVLMVVLLEDGLVQTTLSRWPTTWPTMLLQAGVRVDIAVNRLGQAVFQLGLIAKQLLRLSHMISTWLLPKGVLRGESIHLCSACLPIARRKMPL